MACHEGGEGLKTHPTCHSDTLGGRWVVVEVNGAMAAVVVVEGVSSDTLGGRWVRIPKFAHQWTFVELTGPKNNSKERKRKEKKARKIHPIHFMKPIHIQSTNEARELEEWLATIIQANLNVVKER